MPDIAPDKIPLEDAHQREKSPKKILKFFGILICIILALAIIFGISVFHEIDKYHIIITPGNPSSVSIEPVE